ncbi:phosphatidylinositol 3,4,5-trisphosphate 5-phosphatase 2-like [Triticum urartu]|uniref:phosphatidylinositol 3,4,5-trisphosphate 5-phosphatase 2-like n=1 Tax=Triticum urartu TaxID=4572 RepID=UPI0020434A4B|nr:phosphatidylinositol 3,4,5-trisphosphate 5-phosphatase 2-like [Triticum urartu]
MPAPNTPTQATVSWPDVLEELVNNSVILDGHRTLMKAVMQGVRSSQSGLNDVAQGLLTGFEASSVATTANVAALEEIDRKLKLCDKELDLVNRWLDEAQAAAPKVESLKEALKKAEAAAAAKKMVANEAVAELEKAKLVGEQHEAGITEVQVELHDASKKLEALEKGKEEQSSQLGRSPRRGGLTRQVSGKSSAKSGKRLPALNRTPSTRKKSPPGRLLPRFLSLPTTFCRPTPTTTTFLPPHPRPPLPSAAGAAKRRAAVRPSHLQHLAQPAPPLNHQHPRVPPSTPTCAPPPLCSSPPKATWLPPTVAALPNPVRSGRSGDPATSNRRCPAGSGEIWPPRHGSPPTPTTSYYVSAPWLGHDLPATPLWSAPTPMDRLPPHLSPTDRRRTPLPPLPSLPAAGSSACCCALLHLVQCPRCWRAVLTDLACSAVRPQHLVTRSAVRFSQACSSSPARRAALLCLDGTAPPPSVCSVLFPHHGHKCRFSRLQLGWVVAEVWRHLRSLEPLATIESSVLQ